MHTTPSRFEVFGFYPASGRVSRRAQQGSVLTWQVSVRRETAKAVQLECAQSRRSCWLPKSAIEAASLTGHVPVADWAAIKLRQAGFSAISAEDVL